MTCIRDEGCVCVTVQEAEMCEFGNTPADPEVLEGVISAHWGHETRSGELPPNPKQAYGDLKVPLALVPSSALIWMGRAFKEGARKYGPYNWREKAVETMTYANATLRHLYAWIDGEDVDPESGMPHLGLAMASLAIIADATETGCSIDTRPKKGRAGEMLREMTQKPVDE